MLWTQTVRAVICRHEMETYPKPRTTYLLNYVCKIIVQRLLQLVGLSYECVLDVSLDLLQDSLVVEETMIYIALNS